MSDREIDVHVAAGRLERPYRGVLRFPGAPLTWEQAALAASMAAGPGAVLSHTSAARLWGLLLPDARDIVEVSVPRPGYRRVPGVVVHRSRDLDGGVVTRRRGIPVTKPVRALLDIAASLPASAVEDALDRGLVARLFSVSAVEWLLAETARSGRPGIGPLSKILDERALGRDRPDSLLESRMARVLTRFALPKPEFQQWLKFAGHPPIRVDFLYRGRRLVIEVLGFDPHGGWRRGQADMDRRNVLELNGYHLLEFSWGRVVRRPLYVARTIEAALAPPSGIPDALIHRVGG
jgi:very-short-patch-repair endonuclease